MSRAPFVTPAHATTMLALVDHALAYVPPEHALAYLRGFLVARSWEPIFGDKPAASDVVHADDPRDRFGDPRREPGDRTPIGRVEVIRRP